MNPVLCVIIGIVALALIFDFFNGFHDAANSVATVVTTRVLSNDAQKTMGIIVALLVAGGKKRVGCRRRATVRSQTRDRALDHPGLSRRYGARYDVRRLADCEDDGFAHHTPLATNRRFFGGVRSRYDHWIGYFRAYADFNYPCHWWKRSRSRRHSRNACRALAMGSPYCLGMGPHFPGRGDYRRHLLSGGALDYRTLYPPAGRPGVECE